MTVLTAIKGWGPLPIAEIAALCSLSRRDVEAEVEELRLAGEPIVGDGRGLRYVEDPSELEKYVQARRRRMLSEWKGTVSLKRTLRRMREREALVLWPDVA